MTWLDATLPIVEYRPGEAIAGRYVVSGLLGKGAYGRVYRAHNARLRTLEVAIKVLDAPADDTGVRQRFVREAEILSQLRSDHVVPISDFGETERGQAYLAMPFVAGQTLDAVLRAKRRLPPAQALDYVRQIARGVAAAHALGVVHRDLKPANVLVTGDPDRGEILKVIDFGVARDASNRISSTGAIIGTPAYLSPEQIKSPADVGPEADVWAIGCILFELLTGQLAFYADNVPALILNIIEGRTTRPLSDLPHRELLTRCLELDHNRRPASAAIAQADAAVPPRPPPPRVDALAATLDPAARTADPSAATAPAPIARKRDSNFVSDVLVASDLLVSFRHQVAQLTSLSMAMRGSAASNALAEAERLYAAAWDHVESAGAELDGLGPTARPYASFATSLPIMTKRPFLKVEWVDKYVTASAGFSVLKVEPNTDGVAALERAVVLLKQAAPGIDWAAEVKRRNAPISADLRTPAQNVVRYFGWAVVIGAAAWVLYEAFSDTSGRAKGRDTVEQTATPPSTPDRPMSISPDRWQKVSVGTLALRAPSMPSGEVVSPGVTVFTFVDDDPAELEVEAHELDAVVRADSVGAVLDAAQRELLRGRDAKLALSEELSVSEGIHGRDLLLDFPVHGAAATSRTRILIRIGEPSFYVVSATCRSGATACLHDAEQFVMSAELPSN